MNADLCSSTRISPAHCKVSFTNQQTGRRDYLRSWSPWILLFLLAWPKPRPFRKAMDETGSSRQRCYAHTATPLITMTQGGAVSLTSGARSRVDSPPALRNVELGLAGMVRALPGPTVRIEEVDQLPARSLAPGAIASERALPRLSFTSSCLAVSNIPELAPPTLL